MFRRPEQPEIIIERIQAGDEQLREQFIGECLPEIRHLVRRISHSFFAEQEDEFSIALEAFNQAINRFRNSMGVPFFSYAHLLVKHRLFDWMRRQRAGHSTLSFSDCDSADGVPLEDQLVDPKSTLLDQNLEINESLLQLELQLQLFGFSLPRVTAGFPKHQDSQRLCIRIARQLSEDEQLYSQLVTKHQLPGSELARRCEVPVKTIEKNRASIILLTLLIRSDLQVIHAYISVFEKEAIK
jgi:RNA polymerase sigma factor